jgi:hypothetical protein
MYRNPFDDAEEVSLSCKIGDEKEDISSRQNPFDDEDVPADNSSAPVNPFGDADDNPFSDADDIDPEKMVPIKFSRPIVLPKVSQKSPKVFEALDSPSIDLKHIIRS